MQTVTIESGRKSMHCPAFRGIMNDSDQSKGIPAPPVSKPATAGTTIKLPAFGDILTAPNYVELLDTRRSLRNYSGKALTQEQLTFMLWSTQGIQQAREVNALRPVPSGGCRHPFETYVVIKSVEGLEPGIYHYLPLEDAGEKSATIAKIGTVEDYESTITNMLVGQAWAAKAPAVLFYSCIPYRAEWRYAEASHRVQLIDLGHVGQNAMLSAVALGLGSCCLAAYDQKICDEILGLNGVDEYTVYAVSVGAAE